LLEALVGGEAVRAREALAPTTNRAALLGEARIDDLGVVGSTARTVHGVRIATPPARPGMRSAGGLRATRRLDRLESPHHRSGRRACRRTARSGRRHGAAARSTTACRPAGR